MSKRGWLLFALIGILWGVPYLFMKVAVEELSIAVIVFARLAIGATLLMVIALRQRARVKLRPYVKYILFYAVLEM
jgi:drug/metabolite transporter (DMT)-like permease